LLELYSRKLGNQMGGLTITPVTIPEKLKIEWVMIAGVREFRDVLKWPAIIPKINAPANIKNIVRGVSE